MVVAAVLFVDPISVIFAIVLFEVRSMSKSAGFFAAVALVATVDAVTEVAIGREGMESVWGRESSRRAGEIPIYGLGYDSISDDFKVVRVISLMNNPDHGYDSFTISDPPSAHVFSSKLCSWKSIGEFGYTIRSPVTIINGAPHWVVGHRIELDDHNNSTTKLNCMIIFHVGVFTSHIHRLEYEIEMSIGSKCNRDWIFSDPKRDITVLSGVFVVFDDEVGAKSQIQSPSSEKQTRAPSVNLHQHSRNSHHPNQEENDDKELRKEIEMAMVEGYGGRVESRSSG
ncbi:hypothetical protein Vadar_000337 [Vaccinium darrowii]|uniref:Uncharacterized protein n=1 Tax=Vaccinium darrowii TaxID=229202 RepID=A0ACB7XMG9_9ERIC|nr:hypothetical protein Vadar_000337 [Vaccinium darrowii]